MKKFNVICHYPNDKSEIDNKVSQIYAEAVIRYIRQMNISKADMRDILEKLIYENK